MKARNLYIQVLKTRGAVIGACDLIRMNVLNTLNMVIDMSDFKAIAPLTSVSRVLPIA